MRAASERTNGRSPPADTETKLDADQSLFSGCHAISASGWSWGVQVVRFGLAVMMSVLPLCNGCVQQPPVQAQAIKAVVSTPETQQPPTRLSQADVTVEVIRLRDALLREVPQRLARSKLQDSEWIALAQGIVAASATSIDHPQLIVAVDRDPQVQELCIILAQQAGDPWYVIGGTKVSTGQAGRRGYFITPTGTFAHTSAILDYRALGTFNENHIRGLGLAGMRVWDFGWQTAEKGWLPSHETGQIRLQMHATDPDYLEQRLGRPASEGCIRVPASMNRFLDRHGVLDADYEQSAVADARLAAVLLPDREPTKLAGTFLVVVDSSERPDAEARPT